MPYVIVMTRHFYNEPDRQSLVVSDTGWGAAQFKTPEAATSHIEVIDSGRYDLEYNEADRPSYTVCSVADLPASLEEILDT